MTERRRRERAALVLNTCKIRENTLSKTVLRLTAPFQTPVVRSFLFKVLNPPINTNVLWSICRSTVLSVRNRRISLQQSFAVGLPSLMSTRTLRLRRRWQSSLHTYTEPPINNNNINKWLENSDKRQCRKGGGFFAGKTLMTSWEVIDLLLHTPQQWLTMLFRQHPKIVPSLWVSGPHLIYGSVWTLESTF